MSLASIERRLKAEIKKMHEKQIFRELQANIPKNISDFTSNDYFAMAKYDDFVQKSCSLIKAGFGSASSRLLSGNNPAYKPLEEKLAKAKNTEKALVFSSGYATAIGVIPALMRKKDLIISDKLIHRSAHDGIKLSGALHKRFKHNDLVNLKSILTKYRSEYENCLIISETLFSMDGDFADVKSLYKLAEDYDCLLLLDDAHGFAIFNDYPKEFSHRILIMGTLSKALGSVGGYIACSNLFYQYFVNKAASLIYSTALPEVALLWAESALAEIKSKSLETELLRKISIFCQITGYENKSSPIIIWPCRNIENSLRYKQILFNQGFAVAAIRPPTSATPKLRITISLNNSDYEIKKLAESLTKLSALD